ncbi:MAG: 3-dehydroquinate synthase [Bacteroidales bacterium]|nr:3-dehydroquinate synthase [Bacteroidales bacterium]
MKILNVNAESKPSRILIGEALKNLPEYLEGRQTIILTDSNILKHYRDQLPAGIPIIEIGLGEKNKTLSTLELIMGKLVEYEADRSTFLLAIGGGIVCDVGGFAASVYMRGIPFGFVSTTLLSQVDASVGGKNGVNFGGFKNMVGVFNQPDFVLCDSNLFKTLDKEQFRSGFAEIIKAGAIRDAALFEYCGKHADKALEYDPATLTHMIYESVRIKAAVVEADEREKGERRLLNFGHTFAHAIEKMNGTLHGHAVAIGMVLAAQVSRELGMIRAEDVESIKKTLQRFGLPLRSEIPVSELFNAMKQDKKREGRDIHLVLLESIGKAVTRKFSYSELQNIIHDLRSDS